MAGLVNIKGNDVLVRGNSVVINDVPFATSDEMDIYVRDADGNDNNPGTSAAPLKTLTSLESIIPHFVNHTVRVHVGPHSGSGYAVPRLSSRVLNNRIYIIGDGGGGGTDGFTVIQASTAAGAGSSVDSIFTSGLSTTEYGGLGEYFGKTIQMLSGSATGDRRTIRNNSATEIFPNAPFSATVSPGDLYEVLEPETELYDTSGTESPPFFEGANAVTSDQNLLTEENCLCLVNLKFSTDVVTYYTLNFGMSIIQIYGVVFTEEPWINVSNGGVKCGYGYLDFDTREMSSPNLVSDLGLTRDKEWLGWGIICDAQTIGQGTLRFGGSGLYCQGFFNCEQLFVLDNVSSRFYGGSIWGSDYFAAAIVSGPNAELFIESYGGEILVGTDSGSVGAIACYNGANCKIRSFDYDIIITSSGTAIGCFENGVLDVSSLVVFGGVIRINSSAGLGMITTENGTIAIKENNPIITASVGDFSEDYGASIRSLSSLVSYGDSFIDAYHGRIYRGYP